MAIERQFANSLADEILRAVNAARLVDVDRAVTKRSVWKHRDRDEGRAAILIERAKKIGHAQLGNVIGAPSDHRLENLSYDPGSMELRIHAFDRDSAVCQRRRAIIIPEGDVQAVRYGELHQVGSLTRWQT